MKHPFALCSALLLASAIGCDRTTALPNNLPTAPVANAVSGCYAVSFVWQGTITGTTVSGPLSGDLTGTLTTALDFSTIRITGSTMSISGTGTWEITGGVLPTPLSFETAIENRNQLSDRPGSPSTEFENLGRHRALSGVARANLTYFGTFNAVPTPGTDHRYQGIICP
jgi:hypothetical protein